MANITFPNNLVNDTVADALEVMANFNAVATQVNGNIEAANLASNAITNAKIADDAVDTAEIADEAVESAQIAPTAVTEAKIANGAVTENKLGNLAVTVGKLANDAVETAKIKDANVTAAKLASGAAATNLGNNSITQAMMVDDAIGSAELADASVLAAHMGLQDVFVAEASAETIATGVPENIDWDGSVHYDPANMHDPGTPGTIVLSRTGIWAVHARGQWEADVDGSRQLDIIITGGASVGTPTSFIGGGGTTSILPAATAINQSVAGVFYGETGGALVLNVSQNSGNNRSFSNGQIVLIFLGKVS